MIKKRLRQVAQMLLPPDRFIQLQVWRKRNVEPELRLVPSLCDPAKISIDIGADDGLYLACMHRYSLKCVAFEPRLSAAEHLQRMFAEKAETVKIERVALSNASGTAQLRIVTEDEGRSTIEDENPVVLDPATDIMSVQKRRLDDYDCEGEIGFIKIDVEGHEESVLLGALQLLRRFHPSLIIEIEERHKPGSLNAVRNLLEGIGYSTFYYSKRRLHSISEFNPLKDQDVGSIGRQGAYINNFIFLWNPSPETLRDLR